MTMAFHSSRNETSPYSYSSAFASSSVANFTSKASPLTMKSSFSPSSSANVKLNSHRSPSSPPSPSSSLRFSVEQQPKSPGRRSMTVANDMRNNKAVSSSKSSRPCMCSPTSHPGSFRCAYHKRLAEQEQQRKQKQLQQQQQQQRQQKVLSRSSRALNLRRTAMNNSLILIGGMEAEVAKRSLTTQIRPSPLQLRRREVFQAKPSRLSVMSKAEDS